LTIDEFERWWTAIENHGLSLVLLSALIVFYFIPWIKGMIRKVENVGADKLGRTIELERVITLILAQVANEFNCQWAVLWQFHNGSLSASKVPFMRMSVTHEWVAGGHNPRSEMYQSIPISVFIDGVSVIQKKGNLFVTLDSHYPAIVNSYKRDGVTCGIFTRVNDNNGNMMGVLSISFTTPHDEFSTEQIHKLDIYGVRLASLLEQLAIDYKHPRRRSNDG
jgi:hypothetical protein